MAIDNRYEVIDGATKIQWRVIAVSDQSSSTRKSKANLEAAYQDMHRQVYEEVDRQLCRETHQQINQEVLPTSQKYAERQGYQVDQDSTKAAYRERNHEVDQMVTEADFQRRLLSQAAPTSQCHLPMTTGCKMYSPELGQRKLA
jgi:hypothetical protein